MNDKKSCENCGDKICARHVMRKNHVCDDWQRDSEMWLSIMPTEPGWYWWRGGTKSDPLVVRIYYFSDGTMSTNGAGINYYKMAGNEWQGPITPKEYMDWKHAEALVAKGGKG